ncbi:MAG: xanthine dehydrogenase family protein subunit M [Thermodesulfobacteriota bacterium]
MRFDYLEPKTVEEAISLLEKHNGRAKVIAGGTDLMVQVRDGRISPEFVVDIGGIPGLDYIHYDEDQGLGIGALTPIRSLEKSPVLQRHLPILSQAAGQLGSVAVRNVGTIGGNLCNAAPSAETAPSLIALGGSARIVGPGGERKVPLEGFFAGPGKTVLSPGELLVEVQVPLPAPHTKGIYLKHGIRGTIDLAVVGVAVVIAFEADRLTCKDVRIALGAVAPTPIRAPSAENVLKGKKLDEGLINRSAKVAVGETRCISDVRASAEYRGEMVEVLTRRALKGLMER